MRRTTALVVALPLLAGLTGCGGSGGGADGETLTPTATTSTVTGTASPSPSEMTSSPSGSPSGASATGGLGETFQALGTEPFWNVTVSGTTLVYTPIDQPDIQTDQPDRDLTSTKTGSAEEPTFTGSQDGVEFRLEIKQEACSDGMSDTRYDYAAEFHYGEVELHGCARPVR